MGFRIAAQKRGQHADIRASGDVGAIRNTVRIAFDRFAWGLGGGRGAALETSAGSCLSYVARSPSFACVSNPVLPTAHWRSGRGRQRR